MVRDGIGPCRWAEDEKRWSKLMGMAQAGERDAYELLLSELGDVIEVYLRRRLGAVDCLEDCVQESLLALHRGRNTYDPAKAFRPWMFTIVRHRAIDVLRRLPQSQVALEPELYRAPNTDVSSQHDSAVLLQMLAPKERQAVQLTRLAGYTMAEAGQQCGVSEAAMKVRVHRALRSLKKLLEREALTT
jgi:RNA polymerase sigma-70 factor (ECF subfamily)